MHIDDEIRDLERLLQEMEAASASSLDAVAQEAAPVEEAPSWMLTAPSFDAAAPAVEVAEDAVGAGAMQRYYSISTPPGVCRS